jgi:hypothetical protein
LSVVTDRAELCRRCCGRLCYWRDVRLSVLERYSAFRWPAQRQIGADNDRPPTLGVMTACEPSRREHRSSGSPGASPAATAALPQNTGIKGDGAEDLIRLTIFGCDPDEAALFREKAPQFGITPIITAAAVSEATINFADGSRCVSVGHKSHITNSHLSALSQAGVQYISTRSIGYNHLDLMYAQRVGISVENVTYSPDSVAD